ncbi:fimbrial protein [Erwinia sp. E602]|uniref:fimbrial protein n=1 Tax=Erwinia sp. E602 TaxID=2675378 RepID=UPI001BA8FDA3|nr:fimbrial protein [Erwinia sp. E602]QUG77787.1 fimbrial protein [Erwinia sp. E602]
MTEFTTGLIAPAPRSAGGSLHHAMLLMLSLLTGWTGIAAAGTAQSDITIKVTVLAPVCNVTAPDGGDIAVNFGENINIDKIYDKQYARVFYYKIDCGKGDMTGRTIQLTLKGTPASFATNNATLQTDMDNLGILIYKGGQPMQLNKPLALPAEDDGIMSAMPIKNPAGAIKPGAFSATATLLAEYE